MSRNIDISEDDLQDVLKYFAFPNISFTDFPYTKDQVKDLFIFPAIREYFKWFPIKNYQEYTITNDIDIPFPSNNTFTILHASLNANGVSNGAGTTNPLMNSSIMSYGNNSSYGRRYGTPYNYSQNTTYHIQRAERQAIKNTQNAFKCIVDNVNRKAVGYSNIAGKLTIVWGEYSNKFSDILHSNKEDVVKLSASYLFEAYGLMVSMQSTKLSNELNGDFMISKAQELKTEVIEKWQEFTKVVAIRNS